MKYFSNFSDDYAVAFLSEEQEVHTSLCFFFGAANFNVVFILTYVIIKITFKKKLFGLSTTPEGEIGLWVFGTRIDK